MSGIRTRLIILIILLAIAIGIILFRAGQQLDAIDQQMPNVGWNSSTADHSFHNPSTIALS